MKKISILLMLMALAFVPLAMNGQGAIKANRPIPFNRTGGVSEMNGPERAMNRGDRETTYEKVTSSQSDWSGNYLLAYYDSSTTYAFSGVATDSIGDYATVTSTNSGNTIASQGNAALLTIAPISGTSYYSIQINGGGYLASGTNGLYTSSTVDNYTQWNIAYTSSGIQLNCPIWSGGPYYLVFFRYNDNDNYTWYWEMETSSSYWSYAHYPSLYKETTSGGGDCDYSENFEGVTGTSGYSTAGSLPTGWNYIWSGSNTAYAPHVYASTQTSTPGLPSTGNYLGFYASGSTSEYSYAIMPAFAAGEAANHISFKYKFESASNGTLTYGVIDGTDASTYTILGTISNPSSNPGTVDAALNVSQTTGKRIAFRWYKTSTWYTCGIDDVCVTTANAGLHVTVWTETDQHEAWGSVQIGNDTPGTDVETYVNHGDQITVTATPDECHTFARWIQNGGGNDITQNPATITVNDDLDLQAVFTAITYNVTATPNNSSYGSVSGGGNNLGCGSSCTLTATANTGYGFMGWQLNGNIVSTDNPYTITVNANAAYTAVFEQVSQHTITVTQATGGTISVSANTAYMGNVITLTATPESGYFFVEWLVEDASHNPITVTNNQFTMPNSDVTVTATFTQGFTVTLNQTPNGTISADQTTNLQPGDIVTLTATPDSDCVFLAWYVYKTGNPRAVISVVNDSWFFMPSSDVTVQAIFVTEEEYEQTIGTGSSTSKYLPTYNYYNYSLTQQIYTATEIGYNGRITAIAFKADKSATRTLDIYMAHTDKVAFSSNTDWEVMGSVAQVFSGSVAFVNGWATITLDTPFEYDGTHNLNICVADRTGSCVSSSSNAMGFATYSTGGNRALYKYDDNTDFGANVGISASLSGYSGSRLTSNNQIKFTIKVPGSAESLTISPDVINDFSYVEGQGPSEIHKLDIVGVDLENNITLTAPTNFEISLTENGTYASTVTVPRETDSKGNRSVTTWDFDDSTLQGWTSIDTDGDGYGWVLLTAAGGVYVTNNYSSGGGHNGSADALMSGSWCNVSGSAHALTPNNWLVSPQVTLGGTFSFWVKPEQAAYPNEHFGVYVSTSNDPTDLSSYILMNEWTMANLDWAQYSVDISAFAEQTGYIAIRHFNCTNVFLMRLDDFQLDTDAAISVEMPVTMTLETVFVRMKADLTANTYSGNLTASAGSGNNVNGSVSLSGEVIAAYNITLTANPAEGGSVAGAGSYATGTSVTVSARTNGNYKFINWTENGTVVSTDASYTFTINSDRTLTANFGFKKHIDAWTSTGGWYLITSPLAAATNPTDVANMIPETAANYDLYRFNQNPEHTDDGILEWINYKDKNFEVNEDFGSLEAGTGYLYANASAVDLIFTGSAYSGNGEITLEYDNTNNPDSNMHGWNLVGNPFTVAAGVDHQYYIMNGDRTDIMVGTGNVGAMDGIFVRATASGQKVKFTPSSSKGNTTTNGESVMINLSKDQQVIDRAVVSFDEDQQLPKFQLFENSTKIYIPVDGVDYAVVSSKGIGELPFSFKAEENGTYTLSLNSEGMNLGYLHLIDNMTGNDVDVLVNPSYSFEARTTDYSQRFKLVFATGDNTNDNFAFFSNGSFVINNDGNATLQVIDITGRILKSESINGCTNLNFNAAPGVYMIRLINGTDVKVQKVVVK